MAPLESCPATFQDSSQQRESCSHRAQIDDREHESRLFRFQTDPQMNSRTFNPGDYREGVQMARTKARTIVYRYNDDAKSDEEEFDLHGEVAIPERNAWLMTQG